MKISGFSAAGLRSLAHGNVKKYIKVRVGNIFASRDHNVHQFFRMLGSGFADFHPITPI
jgi:hypothetical protein